jgi:hypothetical protein
MRLIKMLGLCTASVIVIMSVVGISSAAAVDQLVVLCKENNALCPELKQYPVNSTFTSLSSNPKLLGGLNQTCTHSEIDLKLLAMMGNSLPFSITRFVFTGCTPCTKKTAENVPYTSNLTMDASGIYLFTVAGLRFRLTGCPLGVSCVFGSKSVTFEVSNGKEGGEMVAKEMEFKLEEGSEFACGAVARLDGIWRYIVPAATFNSLFEL